MEFNTQTYSDKSFWYLRGIEDQVCKTPDRCGQFIEITLNSVLEKSPIFVKPQSIVFLGTDKHLTAVFSLDYPDKIFLFTGTHYKSFAIIDFFDYSIIDMCNIKHEIHLLTDNNEIIYINLSVTELNNLIAKKNHLSDINVSILSYKHFKYNIFSIEGFNPNINTRIIVWESDRLTFKILAWELNSSKLFLSEYKNDSAVFKATTLNIPKKIFESIKISKCYYHENSKCVYLTDNGGGRVLLLSVAEEKLRAKVIIGNGIKKFQMGSAENARFISPHGITVFDFNGNEYKAFSAAFSFIEESFQTVKSANINNKKNKKSFLGNAFLIVIDKEAKLAITVCVSDQEQKFDRSTELLPLLGNFPNSNLKKHASNLARIDLKYAQNVTRGTSGSLLFWCEGNSNVCILDPKFHEMIKESKIKLTTIRHQPDT